MSATAKMRTCGAALAMGGASLALIASGCGGDDFENEPRPPVQVQLTGVIKDDGVTISPTREGAGPVLITIANQTDQAHTVTLEGEEVEERVGPVQPQDTATIQKTLDTGTYEVRAGSEEAVRPSEEIEPAVLTIGPPRPNSNSQLLLP